MAVTVFSIVAIAATSIFQMAVEGQRNAIAAQNTQESMRYALEMMSKELRMAQKTVDALDRCAEFGLLNKIYVTDINNHELYFKNKDNYCVEYYLDNGRLKIYREDSLGLENTVDDFITPDEIKISNLNFSIYDIGSGDHAKVTMSMDIEAIGKAVNRQPFKIQMTVSSRYYE